MVCGPSLAFLPDYSNGRFPERSWPPGPRGALSEPALWQGRRRMEGILGVTWLLRARLQHSFAEPHTYHNSD